MGRVVLLADNLDNLRKSIAGVLMDHGYEVIHAATRAEALARAPEADVAIIDRSLTEEGALDVVRELRSREETRKLPILIHTARQDEIYEHAAVGAGAQAVLLRPLNHEMLLNELSKLGPPEEEAAPRKGRYVEQRSEEELVRFLARLIEQRVPAVRPEYNPKSPAGYGYPSVEEFFSLPSKEAIKLLGDLVAEGLLDRKLAHKINLCPGCGWHTVNFVEVCPRCKSIDIEIEQVFHHFACAYVGAWSEFKRGTELVCPKCNEKLRHLGKDYERPSETYVCNGCGYAFTDSAVLAECLRCGNASPAEELRATKIHDYAPNPKTSRAVEYGRIYGLDIESVLYEDRSRTFRRDFMFFEIDRERYRALRYKSPLSLVLFSLEGLEKSLGASDPVELARVQRESFEKLADTLRSLDLVSAVDNSCAAVLLPETAVDGAMEVAQRIQKLVSEFQTLRTAGKISTTVAAGELRPEHKSGLEFFDYVHQAFQWAVKSRPGSALRVDECQRETPNA
jgi:CheY-like chemotaxis protein